MVAKNKPEYIKLKEPSDIMSYVQTLVNRFRREDLETDPQYLGKIIYLLNTWLSAYKTNMELVEFNKLAEELEVIKQKLAAREANIVDIQLKNA